MGSSIIVEARSLYERSSPEVKDLAYGFFKSLDTNNNESVEFHEIQSFFRNANFAFSPHHESTLFNELDRNRNNSLEFDEFLTFFYIVFMKAHCDRCNKGLINKKRRTCVTCFMSATGTYDICRSCFHFHRNKHNHPRSDFEKFEEFVFNGNIPGHDMANNAIAINGAEPPRLRFEYLYVALQAAAIGAPFLFAGCSIM